MFASSPFLRTFGINSKQKLTNQSKNPLFLCCENGIYQLRQANLVLYMNAEDSLSVSIEKHYGESNSHRRPSDKNKKILCLSIRHKTFSVLFCEKYLVQIMEGFLFSFLCEFSFPSIWYFSTRYPSLLFLSMQFHFFFGSANTKPRVKAKELDVKAARESSVSVLCCYSVFLLQSAQIANLCHQRLAKQKNNSTQFYYHLFLAQWTQSQHVFLNCFMLNKTSAHDILLTCTFCLFVLRRLHVKLKWGKTEQMWC